MPDEKKEKLVQRYLDGKLNIEEKHDFKQQLKSDPELKGLLDSYSMLFSDIKDLSEVKMPADLWKRKLMPAMRQEMEKEGLGKNNLVPLFTWKKLRPLVSVAAMVVVTISVTLFFQGQMTNEKLTPAQVALANIEKSRLEYVNQLSVLVKDMDDRKQNYDPEIWKVYERTSAKIDEAIADAERVYSVYSDDQEAIQALFAAYDKKAELIQQFMDMEM